MEEKIDRRKIKPLCELCGQEHWRFVKCDDADIQNAREAAAAKRREQAKVYPVWRDQRGRLAPDRRTSWNTNFAHPPTFVLPKRDQ